MAAALTGAALLEARLAELKRQEREQSHALKASLQELVDSISPSGIFKSSLKEVVSSPDLRESILDTAIGIGAGVVGKKLFVGRSDNIFKKLGGTALEFVLANFVRSKLPGFRHKNAPVPAAAPPAASNA